LLTDETCDPFDDSEEAVTAFEAAEWLPLLKHNLADIQRTRELAQLADRFVLQSDFGMIVAPEVNQENQDDGSGLVSQVTFG